MCNICESKMLDYGSGVNLGSYAKLRGGVFGDITACLDLQKFKQGRSKEYSLAYYVSADISGQNDTKQIKIDYCPFCGRKLK